MDFPTDRMNPTQATNFDRHEGRTWIPPPTAVGGIRGRFVVRACRLDLKNPPTAVGGIQVRLLGAAVVFDFVAEKDEAGQTNFVKGDGLEYHRRKSVDASGSTYSAPGTLSWNTPNGSWGMLSDPTYSRSLRNFFNKTVVI